MPGQEFAAHRGTMLDIALRYSPSFLVKGLRIEGLECVFVNYVPMPGLLAKNVPAEGITMVEVYNHRGGRIGRGQEFRMFELSGWTCGGGPIRDSYGPLRTYRPPLPTTVAYIFVWTK